MKLDHQFSGCRAALLLLLAIVAEQWRGAISVILPVQWQPVTVTDADGRQWEAIGSDSVSSVAVAPGSREFNGTRPREDVGQPSSSKAARTALRPQDLLQQYLGPLSHRREQKNIEEDDMDLIFGLPRFAWVILADALGVLADALVWGMPNIAWSVPQIASMLKGGSKVTEEQDVGDTRTPALIQRKATRFLRKGEPHNIEDVDFIWGVPKIVWVLLADAVAMGVFMSAIAGAVYCSRDPPEKTEEEKVQEYREAAADMSARIHAPAYEEETCLSRRMYVEEQRDAPPPTFDGKRMPTPTFDGERMQSGGYDWAERRWV